MMCSRLQRVVLLIAALLFALSNARALYERSSNPYLHIRDDGDDPPIPSCISPCGPGCIGPYKSDSPPNPARRRALSELDARTFDEVYAGADYTSPNPQYVAKRAFYKVTADGVDSFVKNKVNAKSTVQLCFAPDGDQTSTTVQYTFGTAEKYELGTGGLTGCTVLTVVSKRGVFMAHFFESLAFSRPTRAQLIEAGEDPNAYPKIDFNGQVRNLIDQSRGATEGLGPSLDPSLFNQDGDNTQAFIMTPRAWGANTAAGTLQFTNRISQIQQQVMALLPGVLTEIPVTDYVRLNMKDPAQETELFTNARGAAFFQYDPNARRNTRGWRLFYERSLVQEYSWPA